MVSDGALWMSGTLPDADATAPYPQTGVAGRPAGRICCRNCFIEIS